MAYVISEKDSVWIEKFSTSIAIYLTKMDKLDEAVGYSEDENFYNPHMDALFGPPASFDEAEIRTEVDSALWDLRDKWQGSIDVLQRDIDTIYAGKHQYDGDHLQIVIFTIPATASQKRG